MEYTLFGVLGIMLVVVIMLSQITRLEHQNAWLRRENAELKYMLISNRQGEPFGSFGCLVVFLLLFLVTLACISIPGCAAY
jgi:hypothetical protein